jgi:methylenetetrahydrofolate reductase (NADPH)
MPLKRDVPVIDTQILPLFGRRPRLSLEFFPPKTEAAGADLLQSAELIATHLRPDFVSITYGAGGSTSKLTYAYTQLLRERFGWVVMPHLTCVGHTQEELLAIAESYYRVGVRNIMALRGDAPKGSTYSPTPGGCAYASDLVGLLKKHYPEICLGVAGYPEKHPEAADILSDIKNLRHKLEAGGSFVTTQLFFEEQTYVRYVAQCRAAGIGAYILPGLLPPLSLGQLERFAGFCGASIPAPLRERMQGMPEAEQWRAGVDWTVGQIEELLKAGAPGVHLYILNKHTSLLALVEQLRARGLFVAQKD